MTGLAWTLARAGGWSRMALVAACTAVVSALLLVAVALLRLPTRPDELLFTVVADPGTRGGVAFAAALLVVPPLLLLHQAVRLGTAARERRLAALRLAGATPGQVRRLGAVEVGVPALAGSVLGIALYGVLRWLLGGVAHPGGAWGESVRQLVPTSVAPAWWQFLLVVLGVTVAGVAVGLLATRAVVVSPVGMTRRQPARPPRPWGLLPLVAALLLVPVVDSVGSGTVLLGVLVVALAVLGVLGLASWLAYRVGRFTESRTGSAELLLGARRVVAEPRPVGRAAAAVGGIALVSGGAGAIAADLVVRNSGTVDPFYWASLALVAVALLVALLVAAGSLAVHSAESLLDRKRSVSTLVAAGASLRELERSQRLETALVTLPTALLGALLGTVPLGWLVGASSLSGSGVLLLTVAATLVLVWLAIVVAVRVTRPWLRRAAAPANLRTE